MEAKPLKISAIHSFARMFYGKQIDTCYYFRYNVDVNIIGIYRR
jgi:hypothetical protein